MDPLAIILSALVTGAAKAAMDATPDLYSGLTSLIKRKFEARANRTQPQAWINTNKNQKRPNLFWKMN